MQIRDAIASDFAPIAQLTTHYIERTAIHFGAQPVSAEELCCDWQTTRDRYAFLVAEVDGFAGYAKAGPFRARPAYAWTAELGVYVHETQQRRGVARALYQRLIYLSKQQGFHTLVAGIALPNDPSVALHEQLGFAKVGVFREVGFKHGRYHDVGLWQLPLGSAHHGPLKSSAQVA